MPKTELEHHRIKSIKAPNKPIEYFDTIERGLILRVSKAGSKTFSYRYRSNGKNRKYKIGKFPDVGLSEARKIVQQLRIDVDRGKDPQAEKRQSRYKPKELSFKELAERYINRHLPTLRESTRYEYRRIIENELIPSLGVYPASEINRKNIIDLLDSIAIDREAPVQSNRTRAVLSSIFTFGIDKAILETNPVLAVKKKKVRRDGKPVERRRERIYDADEIRALWEAFQVQAEPMRSIFLMLLICAQRSGETRRMKWQDVDIKKGLWIIPAEQTKAKRTHTVPLPETALDVLENSKRKAGESDYVFESPRKPGQPVDWLQKAVLRIREISGVSDFRVHDLRRTAATYMAETGTSRTVLGKILNHKELSGDDQVTAIYDRHDYMDEKRSALQRWSDQLRRIVTGKDEPKIHKIR